MTDPYSATAAALGYLYQIRFALLLLVRSVREDTAQQLSIECLDDVAFAQEGQPQELIQFKHTLRTRASLTDASTEVWKTLRVWSERLSATGHLIDQAVLTLITSAHAADGSAAAQLREGQGRDESKALTLLQKTAATSKSKANQDAYDAFTALTLAQQTWLVSKIRVVDDAPNILDVHDKLIREARVYVKHPAALVSRLEGWWFTQVVQHLADPTGRPFITGEDLMATTHSLVSQLQDDSLPVDFDFEEIDEAQLSPKERVFIEQLRLVLSNPTRLRMAVGHYYRAYRQRSKWLREGLILPDELKRYEQDLILEWRTQFEIMRDDLDELPDEADMVRLGRALFNWADTSTIRRLRPRHDDPSFPRGSYHMLANDFQVGWHPEFTQRLAHLMADAARAT